MKNIKLTKAIESILILASLFAITPIGASAEWKQDSNGWWNKEGNSYSIGWKQIDGIWYYFLENGYMAHDTTIDGYKLGSDGAWVQSTEKSSSSIIEKSTQKSYEELDKLPHKYTNEMALKDGDVIEVVGIDYNIEKLDKFIENYKNKKSNVGDMVRIINYTDEGDPIIFDLNIESDGVKLKVDSTRDAYSSHDDQIVREYKVVDIYKINMTEYIEYYVKTEQGNEQFLYASSIH